MFHHRLLELESELLAREKISCELAAPSVHCDALLDFIQQQVEVRLCDKVPADWRSWLTYRRGQGSLIVVRGRAFKSSWLGGYKAGLDTALGADAISEYERGFDVAPPQELDHLKVSFTRENTQERILMWFGENIVPYKLILSEPVDSEPHHLISEALVEACVWIMKRPKNLTLKQYLLQLDKENP